MEEEEGDVYARDANGEETKLDRHTFVLWVALPVCKLEVNISTCGNDVHASVLVVRHVTDLLRWLTQAYRPTAPARAVECIPREGIFSVGPSVVDEREALLAFLVAECRESFYSTRS